ncbi:hypothetical protein FA15DRAFT_676427 [Coprinopsis marcescibilis]|uniref:Uncharacterized protein n=1 Tax=Coprinopsis marcescibilis TaxID=230819 RepID=A0A5C3KA42_COPMA|nr:hypothetical protein FA15DRAFT_676427 [Coprinopsis marcescibilis]
MAQVYPPHSIPPHSIPSIILHKANKKTTHNFSTTTITMDSFAIIPTVVTDIPADEERQGPSSAPWVFCTIA